MKKYQIKLRCFPAYRFSKPRWVNGAGEAGAYVADSLCGQCEAIAVPLERGFHFFLVRIIDGATLEEAVIQ